MNEFNTLHQHYLDHGYVTHPESIVPDHLIEKALARVGPIIQGEYDMGFEPLRRWNLDAPSSVKKIDQVHVCDNAFYNLVTCTSLMERVAQLCGVNRLQVWCSQLFIKPAGGGEQGNIGWHTDEANWGCWDGDVFTVWLPLVDVDHTIGSIGYIPDSHKYKVNASVEDAYNQDLLMTEKSFSEQLPSGMFKPDFVELPKGAFSIHHKGTLHGSGSNVSDRVRVCLAINLRSEHSAPIFDRDDGGFLQHINNPVFCPTVYQKQLVPEA